MLVEMTDQLARDAEEYWVLEWDRRKPHRKAEQKPVRASVGGPEHGISNIVDELQGLPLGAVLEGWVVDSTPQEIVCLSLRSGCLCTNASVSDLCLYFLHF